MSSPAAAIAIARPTGAPPTGRGMMFAPLCREVSVNFRGAFSA